MINAVDPAQSGANNSDALFAGLGSEAFLELLIAQMRHQDPLEPMDGAAMLEQTSQFANVEALQRLTDLQTQMLGFSQFQSATAMIGKQVSIADVVTGTDFSGVVLGVRATTSGPMLQFAGGIEHSVQHVTQVQVEDPVELEEPESPDSPDSSGVAQ